MLAMPLRILAKGTLFLWSLKRRDRDIVMLRTDGELIHCQRNGTGNNKNCPEVHHIL